MLGFLKSAGAFALEKVGGRSVTKLDAMLRLLFRATKCGRRLLFTLWRLLRYDRGCKGYNISVDMICNALVAELELCNRQRQMLHQLATEVSTNSPTGSA